MSPRGMGHKGRGWIVRLRTSDQRIPCAAAAAAVDRLPSSDPTMGPSPGWLKLMISGTSTVTASVKGPPMLLWWISRHGERGHPPEMER